MKSRFMLFTGLLVFLFIFTACSSDNENSNTNVSTNESGQADEVAEDMVRITIAINNGEQFVNEQEVEIEEGDNLLEVLDNTFFIETNDEDVITSIERMQVDAEEGTTWVLFVNDKETETPAKEYQINGGERITFDLQ